MTDRHRAKLARKDRRKKKLIVFCCILCISLLITACTNSADYGAGPFGGSDSSQVTASDSQTPSIAVPPNSIPDQSISPSSTSGEVISPPEGFDVVQIPSDDANESVPFGEQMLTKSQEAAILTLVQNVVDGFREEWLPLPIVEGTKGRLGQPLPEGVGLPETVNYGNYAISSNNTEMWGGLKANLPLDNGYMLSVYVTQKNDEQLGPIIFIIDATFLKAEYRIILAYLHEKRRYSNEKGFIDHIGNSFGIGRRFERLYR